MTHFDSTASGAPFWEDSKAGADMTAMGSRAIFAQVSGVDVGRHLHAVSPLG